MLTVFLGVFIIFHYVHRKIPQKQIIVNVLLSVLLPNNFLNQQFCVVHKLWIKFNYIHHNVVNK